MMIATEPVFSFAADGDTKFHQSSSSTMIISVGGSTPKTDYKKVHVARRRQAKKIHDEIHKHTIIQQDTLSDSIIWASDNTGWVTDGSSPTQSTNNLKGASIIQKIYDDWKRWRRET